MTYYDANLMEWGTEYVLSWSMYGAYGTYIISTENIIEESINVIGATLISSVNGEYVYEGNMTSFTYYAYVQNEWNFYWGLEAISWSYIT